MPCLLFRNTIVKPHKFIIRYAEKQDLAYPVCKRAYTFQPALRLFLFKSDLFIVFRCFPDKIFNVHIRLRFHSFYHTSRYSGKKFLMHTHSTPSALYTASSTL